jgi:outer membrane protein OmpA-like peptidoglycan-associated protein
MLFGTTGCVATRKYTRNTVAPVEARVSANEKKTSDHASAINELENGLSRTDERAMDADRKARAAQESADAAARSANEAGTRADAARQLAENAGSRIGEVVENLDNYQLVTTENVLFPVNKYVLTKEAKDKLDQAVANVGNAKSYILEVQGFTDRTGSKTANLALSEQRADAVVRYLTTQHQIPLRKIHVLGQGVDPDQKGRSRTARREARRVEVKMFALNLGGPATAGNQASSMNNTGTSNTSGMNTSNSGTTYGGTRNRTDSTTNSNMNDRSNMNGAAGSNMNSRPNPNYTTPSNSGTTNTNNSTSGSSTTNPPQE